jgi:hypothetical protein
MNAYRDAGWMIAARNLQSNYQADKQEYMDKLKDIYKAFVIKVNVLVARMFQMANKWQTKTPEIIGE